MRSNLNIRKIQSNLIHILGLAKPKYHMDSAYNPKYHIERKKTNLAKRIITRQIIYDGSNKTQNLNEFGKNRILFKSWI